MSAKSAIVRIIDVMDLKSNSVCGASSSSPSCASLYCMDLALVDPLRLVDDLKIISFSAINLD